MPELSGVELIDIINKYNPEAKKVMISGYELIDEDVAKDFGIDEFLRKPISQEDVVRLINEGKKT